MRKLEISSVKNQEIPDISPQRNSAMTLMRFAEPSFPDEKGKFP